MKYDKQRFNLMALMGAMSIDAILGVALTTIINFDPHHSTAGQTAVLITHVVIAVGLIIGGTVQLIFAFRNKAMQVPAVAGFACLLGAFASGSVAANSGNSVAVFLMATFFIVGIGIYGFSLGQLNKLSVKK